MCIAHTEVWKLTLYQTQLYEKLSFKTWFRGEKEELNILNHTNVIVGVQTHEILIFIWQLECPFKPWIIIESDWV